MPRRSSRKDSSEGGGGGDGDEQLKSVLHIFNESWKSLDHLWNRMGHDPPVMLKRKTIVLKHVKELLDEMVEEEKLRVKEKEEQIKNQVKEIEVLSGELTLDGTLVAQAKESANGKPLLQAEMMYVDVLTDLRRRKEIRMEKFNIVNDQVVRLSEELLEKPMEVEYNGIPSDNQVAKLEQHLSQLKKVKQKRQGTFKLLKKSIVNLLDCVDRAPTTELEKLISTSSADDQNDIDNNKILTLKVLNAMEELDAEFKNQVQLNTEEGDRLWQKIRELWSRLSIEEEIQYGFENVHKSVEKIVGDKKKAIYTPGVLKGLRAELNRLEEEKRRNMALFINQVRDELTELWTGKCFMTHCDMRFEHPNYAQVTAFRQEDFTSDLYSEELLTKHETEVEFWRQFIERNQKIIDLINKRRNQFAQYQELEFKSDDPARLANRGGALLKEEKQRKMLSKAIPKLEKELKELSAAFEQTRDAGFQMKKFLVRGIGIEDMIEQEWNEFLEEKERRKESRKVNGNATTATAAMGKTMMSNHGNTNQPIGSRKRPATPSSQKFCVNTPIKRNKLAPVTPVRTPSTLKKYPSTASKIGATPPTKLSNPVQKTRYVHGRPPTGKSPLDYRVQARKLVRKSIKSRTGGQGSLLSQNSSGHSSCFGNRNDQSLLSASAMGGNSVLDPASSSGVPGRNHPLVLTFNESQQSYVSFQGAQGQGDDTFARPTTRSKIATVPSRVPNGSRIPSRDRSRKEQVPPFPTRPGPDYILSPTNSYSEFSEPLMCQSTLNSSTVSTISKQRNPLKIVSTEVVGTQPVTPTKPERTGLAFTPAKKQTQEYF